MAQTEQARGENRRKFARVPCDATAMVVVGETIRRGHLVDISMKGVLVALDDVDGMSTGLGVEISILLASDSPRIRMTGTCAHVRDQQVGIRWERMDLESFWHLRRIIELNSASGRDSDAELAALLDTLEPAASA